MVARQNEIYEKGLVLMMLFFVFLFLFSLLLLLKLNVASNNVDIFATMATQHIF